MLTSSLILKKLENANRHIITILWWTKFVSCRNVSRTVLAMSVLMRSFSWLGGLPITLLAPSINNVDELVFHGVVETLG